MNESQIFNNALKLATPAERTAYLDEACGGNVQLRCDVDTLLKAHADDPGFLESPDPAGATITDQISERPGSVIGPYKLLQEIGEGGMGIVFMAEQTHPVQRKVALKVIKPGMDSRQVIARFEAERQALAMMDHVNIARVFDGGTTENGRPYFVMELVHGVPITKYCDDNHLTPRERLELFVPVCQAIQHAHQKGIIHRDIKPSNVMVTLYDGKPVPKVIDFGVAKATEQKLTERTLFTQYDTMVGTLEYMSPEQAGMSALGVDTRSDIYSLGVLLYELLTGSTPLTHKWMKEAAHAEILRMIKEEEPPKPSTRLSDSGEALASISANRHSEPARLTKLVRGELDWIVMKCLEKDRSRRYETAKDFAADVQRYLDDEPVQACPPSAWYRFRKSARRNKAAIGVAALVLFFLVLLGSGVGWALRDREARELEIAQETARKLARTEQGIRLALDRGAASRSELHVLLKKPGGVQQLLNQTARWELLIMTAQGELAQARQLAVGAEGTLDAGSTQALSELERLLASDQADYDLALRLERIRLDRAIWVGGQDDYRKVADEYDRAFAGLAVLKDDPAIAAARIASSPIKDQLVAALDDWALVALYTSQSLSEQLLAAARIAAPDPAWGDRLRQPKVLSDQKALGKLVAEAPAAGLSPQLLHLVGSMLFSGGNPQTETWLRRAQAQHPADFWLNFSLAHAIANTNAVEAAGFFRVALAVRPGASGVYLGLGSVLFRQERLPEAIASYHKAIELNPRTVISVGSNLVYAKRLPEAIAAYRKAIDLDPKFASAHYNLGCLFHEENPDQAITCYRKAIENDPKHVEAHINLGNILKTQGKLDQAIASYHKAIEFDPEYANAYYNLAIAWNTQGNLNEAIAAYRKSIELSPKYVDGGDMLLKAALSQDTPFDEANAAFVKAVELDSKYGDAIGGSARVLHPKVLANAYNMLSYALHSQGDVDEAIAACRQAIKLDPKSSWAHDFLGNLLQRNGHLDEAIEALAKVVELKPNHAKSHNTLAWLLATCPEARFRDPKRAVELATKAVELDPSSGTYWNSLGTAHYRAGNWKDAVAALEKSMELRKGGDSNDWFFLAMVHWQLDDKEAARKSYAQALEWMDQHAPQNEELRRFRTEAAELLGIEKKKD